ncbi:hypothetical protein Csa_011081 [Cucumis sativus]|uniref:Uncharacterized protein n=1 Tax=Cucumis sativus TaxID=3659 RepID=A0A0A0L2B2_CUCSA|nr:hypothetical protein Csa_011081 [Cucumis sativus]
MAKHQGLDMVARQRTYGGAARSTKPSSVIDERRPRGATSVNWCAVWISEALS